MSKIEWTEETLNVVTGCTPVSEGCKNCYAKSWHKRLRAMGQKKYAHDFNKVIFHPVLCSIYKNKKKMIFLNSMSDTFHEQLTFDRIFEIFGMMALNPNTTFQVLTKRAERATEFFNHYFSPKYVMDNLWFGVSIEKQKYLDRINSFTASCAKINWISFEPLLEEIQINIIDCSNIDWVVIGCESGPKRRETKIEWITELTNLCKHYNIPVFIKQMEIDGKVEKLIYKFPEHLRIREYPKY